MKRKIVLAVQRLFKIPVFEKVLILIIEYFPAIRFTRKFAPQNYEFKSDEVRLCKRYGINYKLYIQDYQSWLLYFYCDYDSSFDVLKYSKKGYTIIDVGGNIGQTAMMLGKSVGKNGTIISFEPFHKTHKHFKYNLSLNKDINNIVLEHSGLGETISVSSMVEVCSTNSGGNRITNSQELDQTSVSVKITTLDEYILEKNISKIDLIKIDVEGFEMKVLKGSLNTLKRNKPDLFIEIDDTNLNKQGDSAQFMINFLLELEYDVYDVINSKKIFKFSELSDNSRDIYCKHKLTG